MDTCIDGTRIDFRISGAGSIDDSVVVFVGTVRISTLMDAARVTKRIVAVTAEGNDLWVFVEHGVQPPHGPGCTFEVAPGAVAGVTRRNVGEDEDWLAGSIFSCLLKITFQGIHHSSWVRSCAITSVIIVIVSSAATYRDEGIAFDEHILVERITLIAVECLQTVLVVLLSLIVAGIVVVVAHHEKEIIDGVEDVLIAAEELNELFVLIGSSVVGEVAHDCHSIELA